MNDIENSINKQLIEENYDYSDKTLEGFSISNVQKYTSSSIQKSHTFEIPKSVFKIKVNNESEVNTVVAFLNSYVPVTKETPDFSNEYPNRIVIEPNQSQEFIIKGNMNYLFTLLKTSSGVDCTPITTLYTFTDKNLNVDGIPADSKAVGEKLNDVTKSIYKYNNIDVLELYFNNTSSKEENGISFNKNNDGSWDISGTSTDVAFCNVLGASTKLPDYVIPGRSYKLLMNNSNVALQIFYYYSDGTPRLSSLYREDAEITIPINCTGIIGRLRIDSNKTINTNIKYNLISIPITGSGITTITDNQYLYNNTYNITTAPTITTDSNGWLQAIDTYSEDESNKTDMTGPIMSMLTDTGYCHLSEGIFYVSGNIDMPEGSMIEGCGEKTIIKLLQSTTAGYCIKMCKYNTVQNIKFEGGDTITEQEGTRIGILFSANKDGSEGNTAYETECCMLNNIWISNFSDSGIKCHNTSTNVRRGIYATNLYIIQCWCGINIDYYSEFNKFTNISISSCYYGCINKGGNNVFTACTFHATNTGFYIDGSQPNSAHGTINGCTFCHIGSNNGTAFKAIGVVAGFIISNCQFWYNSVYVENSRGVLFSNCEFGRGISNDGSVSASITVDGGESTIFNGCMFHLDSQRPPKITKLNNAKTIFTACYGTESGELITV